MTNYKPSIGLSFLEKLDLGLMKMVAVHPRLDGQWAMQDIIHKARHNADKDPLAYYKCLTLVLCTVGSVKNDRPGSDEIFSHTVDAIRDIAPVLCEHGYVADAVIASGIAIKLSGIDRACKVSHLRHCCE